MRWAVDLLTAACARSETEQVEEDPAAFSADAGARRRILIVKAPDQTVLSLIEAGAAPVVVLLDDPVDCVRAYREADDCDLGKALRDLTAAAAGHHLLSRPHATVVTRAVKSTAREVARTILQHCAVTLDALAVEEVLTALCGTADEGLTLEQALARHGPDYCDLADMPARVSAEDASVIRHVLSPLLRGALGDDPGLIVWPARVFWRHDEPTPGSSPLVDLTGPMRCIYFGPYFHLPPGQWDVRFRVAFSKEARDVKFTMIVLCGDQRLAHVGFQPKSAGAFEGKFDMRHANPFTRVEINLVMAEGAIEGIMILGDISFERAPLSR